MKLPEIIPSDIVSTLTPTPAPSRTSISSKTPGRDLEDRWSLIDQMLGSSTNLQGRSLWVY